jgi:hypothetical protein
VQNRRLCVRLHEKGGKQHEMPCRHSLEEYLDAYLDAGGLRDQPRNPLFRTIGRGTGVLTGTPLPQANAYAMIQRRAEAFQSQLDASRTTTASKPSQLGA